MAEVQAGNITPKQLEDILRTLVSEIRKPPTDPIKEKQKEREKAAKDAGNRERWRAIISKLCRCAHSRQDGTCVVGWARQSDGVERGYCPNCCGNDVVIGPETEGLADLVDSLFTDKTEETRKELKETLRNLYKAQRVRPRGLMENVRYVA